MKLYIYDAIHESLIGIGTSEKQQIDQIGPYFSQRQHQETDMI